MSRDEMQQFVEKFKAPDRKPVGEGRELDVDLEPDKPRVGPDHRLVDPITGVSESRRVGRGPGTTANDAIGQNRQGGGVAPPPEYRAKFESYRKQISETVVPPSSPPSPAPRP